MTDYEKIPKTYAAHIGRETAVTVRHDDAYDLSMGNFTVSFLLSVEMEGMVVGCVKDRQADTKYKTGWYVEIQKGGRIYFYTGDGIRYSAVKSVAVPKVEEGYLSFITCIRQDGKLSVFLEDRELECAVEGYRETINVTSGTGVYFGGLESEYEGRFCGALQNVALWRKAATKDELACIFNKILPPDTSCLIGWWMFDQDLLDRSPVHNSISNARNLSFVEIFDMLWTEDGDYVYQCVAEGEPTYSISREERLKSFYDTGPGIRWIKRRFTIPVYGSGALVGSINDAIETAVYPEGVTLDITSPSGVSMAEMSNSESQWIVRNWYVWQFVIMNPEEGDWIVEIGASEGLNFDFDCQFIPKDVDMTRVSHAMQQIYSRYENSTSADGIRPESFIFKPFARMVAHYHDERRSGRSNFEILTTICVVLTLVCAKYAYDQIMEQLEMPSSEDDTDLNTMWISYNYEMDYLFYEGDYQTGILYEDIKKKFKGIGAPQDSKKFYCKEDVKKLGKAQKQDWDYKKLKIHLDLGGEGCFQERYKENGKVVAMGLKSGWNTAININSQKNNSQKKDMAIPYLILVSKSWTDSLPFENDMITRITAQGTGYFTEKEREEIVRCIRKDTEGKIDLWCMQDQYIYYKFDDIANRLNKKLPPGYRAVLKKQVSDPEFHASRYSEDYYKYSIVIEEKEL